MDSSPLFPDAFSSFRIDELLDFPHDYDLDSRSTLADCASDCPASSTSFLQPPLGSSLPVSSPLSSSHGCSARNCSRANPSSFLHEFSGPPSGLSVPPDELVDQLEWLSAFVEDSSYSANTTLAPLTSSDDSNRSSADAQKTTKMFHSPSPVSVLNQAGTFSERPPSFIVPSRARSKRSRTGGRVWSFDTIIPSLVENRLGTHDMVYIECTGARETSSSEQGADIVSKPSKKTKEASAGFRSIEGPPLRRCTHCLVQKTPQWRAGPLGPKTLCNACGVRYKSGRLLPEYRPAGSPTFAIGVHSNSHKRILEMRTLKESEVPGKDERTVRAGANGQKEAHEGRSGAGRAEIRESTTESADAPKAEEGDGDTKVGQEILPESDAPKAHEDRRSRTVTKNEERQRQGDQQRIYISIDEQTE